jgi:hypothetical protein
MLLAAGRLRLVRACPRGPQLGRTFKVQFWGSTPRGLVLPVIARLRIGGGSERGEAGVGRGPLSGSPGGGWRQIRFHPCSGYMYCMGTAPLLELISMRIAADLRRTIGVVSISGDIVTLALVADPPCELDGGKQFAQHF